MPIRPMQLSDLGLIMEMEQRLQHKPWTRTAFEQALRLKHTCQVYEKGGKIEGYGVADKGHGRTIAAETLQAAGALYRVWLESAKESGVDKLYAEVQPENAAARARLERFGFTVAGTRPSYYGPGQDALVYEQLVSNQDSTKAEIECS